MRGWQGAQHHCFPVLPGLWHQSVGKAGTPCQATTPRLAAHRAGRLLVASVARARYGHPLRFYIRPHCPQCPAVIALKLHLVPATASRPSGEGNRHYAKWPTLEAVAQPSALPGQFLPYAPPSGRPCGCRSTVALVSCFASVPVSGLRPVFTCVPLPTHRGLAAARHWPPCAGLPVCPPWGLPQPR